MRTKGERSVSQKNLILCTEGIEAVAKFRLLMDILSIPQQASVLPLFQSDIMVIYI